MKDRPRTRTGHPHPAKSASPHGERGHQAHRPSASPPLVPVRFAWPVLGLGLLIAIARWIEFRVRTGLVLEDALITYRYAENVAQGNGFVFNPGEHVLGTTTPLYTLILAALGAIFGTDRLPILSTILGISFGLAAAVLVALALERVSRSRWVGVGGGLFLALHPEVAWMATGGLETPLVLALMGLSLHAYLVQRWALCVTALALLVLTRIDGAIWGTVLIAFAAPRGGRTLLASLGLGALVLVPWVVYATATFGSPVPHSIVAKQWIGMPVSPLAYGHWLGEALGIRSAGLLAPLGLVLWSTALAIGVWKILSDGQVRALAPLIVFAGLYPVILIVGRAPVSFPWYWAPLLCCIVMIVAIGVAEIHRRLTSTAARWSSHRSLVTIGFALLSLPVVTALGSRHRDLLAYHLDFQTNEEHTRARIGEWLREHTPPDASVAMEGIGYQGTLARRRIIDLGGLVTPAVVTIRRTSRSNAEAFERVLRELRPDFVVLRTAEVERNMHLYGGPLFETEEQARFFESHYAAARQFEAPRGVWGLFGRLTIYGPRR